MSKTQNDSVIICLYFNGQIPEIFILLLQKIKSMAKRTYSTGLKIKYKLGLLPKEVTLQIHRNTRRYWDNKLNINQIFGIEDFEENEDDIKLLSKIFEIEKLKKMVIALTKTYFVLLAIINSLPRKENLLYQQSTSIINIIDEFKNNFGLLIMCKLLCISSQRYYTWKFENYCVHPIKEFCKKIVPHQLSFAEQGIIKKYLFNPNYINWGVSNIYYRMLEEGKAAMSLQSFRNYTNLFYPRIKLPKNKKNQHRIGIRATKPFEKLHMDVTIYRPLDNTKVYIYFIVDNFSRKILSWKTSLKIKADISFDNLKQACLENNLFNNETELIVDGGSENKGAVDGFIVNHKNWKKIIAQKDIIFSNSIVEAVNKILKYQYIFKRSFSDFADINNNLGSFVDDYNNRPHSVLKLSPNDVALGKTFDKDKYKEKLKEARAKRIKENKACDKCNFSR